MSGPRARYQGPHVPARRRMRVPASPEGEAVADTIKAFSAQAKYKPLHHSTGINLASDER